MRYLFLIILGILGAIALLALALGGSHIVLFSPKGYIAAREMALVALSLKLMLLVVVPVFVLTAAVAWHYRAGNTSARYFPNWDHNTIEEGIWWTVPLLIIVVLATITWGQTHALDPYRSIASTTPALDIEVVSLDWKWLFIYPAQGIATLNTLTIPVGTPVHFSLTSDAPMNALWIPQLAGQEMTMPGMETQLSILADAVGDYHGLSGNYSGTGFAGMQFTVHAVSPAAFAAWAAGAERATTTLDRESYAALAKPSEDVPPTSYVLGDANLYTEIMQRYMTPSATTTP